MSIVRLLVDSTRALPLLLGLTLTYAPITGVVGADVPPDVVVLLCDDFNPFYAGFAGDPDARTPNLDALAQESAVFTRCYTASPVCMPSRTSLVSGLYPHNTGCWGNANELFVPPELTSMFSDFKAAGYRTAVVGKTHWYAGNGYRSRFADLTDYMPAIGVDSYQEVSTTFGSRSGEGVYQDFLRKIGKFDVQAKDLTNRLANNQYVPRPSLLNVEETCDWMMTDFALKLIADAPRKQPFALLVGFSNPHAPFDPAGKYATMYDSQAVTLRENVQPFKKYETEYTLDEVRKAKAAYLGKISFLDDLLGRVVSALKQRGTWNRTVLVFTADHGLAVGEHRNLAKGQFWEEVARVPFLLRVPGLTDDGIETDALSQLVDLYPTLIDLAGGTVAAHVRGRSLLPILRDPAAAVRDAVFCEIHHRGALDYMVATNRHKWFLQKGQEHLYDLQIDPFEQHNLIDSPDHQQIAGELRERLRKFLMEEQLNYSAGYKPLAQRVKEAMKK